MKKKYKAPLSRYIEIDGNGIMAASGGTNPPVIVRDPDDNNLEEGGDDNEGIYGDAKRHQSVWDE